MAKLMTRTGSQEHQVVSPKEWIAARKKLLAAEKKFTRLHDELKQKRRDLPWEKVEKEYVFEGPDGPETLADLFAGKRQLIVYHFMFSPDWTEGCPHCSFWADHFDNVGVHLAHRDTTLLAISRAPLKIIERFKRRMGWKFKWVSSAGNTFNYDFHVSFTPEDIEAGKVVYNFAKNDWGSEDLPGLSVFYKENSGRRRANSGTGTGHTAARSQSPNSTVYRTYSTYARGIEIVNTTYNFLDLTAKGRDENPKKPMDWVRYHDRYAAEK